MVDYKEAYKFYINRLIDHLIEHNVMYAELRPVLLVSKNGMTNDEKLKLIEEAVESNKDRFKFGLKIIYSTPRSFPKEKMREELDECLRLKKKFPSLICGKFDHRLRKLGANPVGFDLVGAEDRGKDLGHFREEFVRFRLACRNATVDIPFMFHAGETLLDTGGTDDPSNSNLREAVLHNPKRIGHGFALMKHPDLLEHFKRTPGKPGSGICVELCPISNELLHLCRNVKQHPFPEILAAGVPCTINTDNQNIFR